MVPAGGSAAGCALRPGFLGSFLPFSLCELVSPLSAKSCASDVSSPWSDRIVRGVESGRIEKGEVKTFRRRTCGKKAIKTLTEVKF